MGVIFDTSAIITIERNRERIEELLRGREDQPFGISVVSVADLLHSVERAGTEKRRLRRQAFVDRVIDLFPVFVFDTTIARMYARIWASLATKGLRIGAHDLIIAATAISLDYSVLTSNMRDFGKIEGLRVEKQ